MKASRPFCFPAYPTHPTYLTYPTYPTYLTHRTLPDPPDLNCPRYTPVDMYFFIAATVRSTSAMVL